MKAIRIKRIYEDASAHDGYRILIDRLWPRGLSKTDARIDEWDKEVAPSPSLRKWFSHLKERFPEFARRYRAELDDKEVELEKIKEIARAQNVTLLYAAKDTRVNHAKVLKEVLTKK
jgi:uncharacterized protein YeaO (DUF488 family)